MTHVENAEIELAHIQLELDRRGNRPRHLRHFIDQYFCYTNGYVNRNGGADWNRIFWSEWVSASALQNKGNVNVVKEHVVPLRVIEEMLRELPRDQDGKVAIADIKCILDNYVIFATITQEEDDWLREAGLSQSMPIGVAWPQENTFEWKFSRYQELGIVVEETTS